jgi:oligopeptidase B
MQKKNTFLDFIAVAKHLIAQGYTRPNLMAIEGTSAGGLLIGAVLNMEGKSICNLAVLEVPFVDVINTMLDESLPNTVAEFDEWGNPKKVDQFKYMLSYSAYDNIAAKEYPNMLVRGGLQDNRVMYWEPLKYTAKMRALKKDTNTLLLKMETAGHFGTCRVAFVTVICLVP